jgi:hypothetical protein
MQPEDLICNQRPDFQGTTDKWLVGRSSLSATSAALTDRSRLMG